MTTDSERLRVDEALEHVHWCDECEQYECSICYDWDADSEAEVAAHIVTSHKRPWVNL